MESEKRNKSLLAPLLRWLTGDANRHDERLLDAAAQSDPFLADAIEGYRALPGADHAADVTRLKAGLRKRTQRQRGAGFYLMRAAAALAVIVVAWLVVQQFIGNDKAAVADIAAQPAEESATAATSAASADSTLDFAADQTSPQRNMTANQSLRDEIAEKSAPPAPRIEPPAASTAPQPEEANNRLYKIRANEDVVAQTDLEKAKEEAMARKEAEHRKIEAAEKTKMDTEAKAKAAEKPKPQDAAPAAPVKEEMASALKKKSDASRPRQITGQVTDGNGSPLIGASVVASGTNAGAITNVDGTYSLNLPAGATSLEFNFTGYNPLRVTLGGNDKVDVELTENEASLSEVVVTGYGQASDEQPAYESLRPVGGFKQFKQYVANNLRHPEADKQPRPKQVVRVRFTLQSDGSLTNFNPKSDAPQAYKDEAVRLLREGPRWEGTTGTTASYRFVFE